MVLALGDVGAVYESRKVTKVPNGGQVEHKYNQVKHILKYNQGSNDVQIINKKQDSHQELIETIKNYGQEARRHWVDCAVGTTSSNQFFRGTYATA